MAPSLTALLRQAVERHPDRPAVLREEGVTTYAELWTQVEGVAGLLHQLGLAGKRIGLLLPNTPSFPAAVHGAWRAGCGVVLLNPVNSPRETEEYLEDSGVRDVITTRALLGLLPQGTRALLADALPQALLSSGAVDDEELPLDDAPPPPPLAEDADAEAAIVYTAAVDGWARGAILSHRNLAANALSTVEAMALVPEDRVIAVLPMIHAFALTVSLNAPLLQGAAVLPVERFNPLRVLDLLEELKVTVLAGVPAIYLGLLAAVERRGVPDHALRMALCGGAPLPEEAGREWEGAFGLPLREGYGLTEAGPVCLFNRVDRPNRPGTLGSPFPGVEVSIRDADGSQLPPQEVGEICVRGENVFQGYLGDGGRREGDFYGDWLRTGDLGTEEPDGTFRFRGVLKAMFTRNGFNVYPREVERVLASHYRIASASVCALPSPARENDIVLRVVAAPGESLTEEEVREFCRSVLAAYKQPTRVEIVTS